MQDCVCLCLWFCVSTNMGVWLVNPPNMGQLVMQQSMSVVKV